MFQWFVDVSRAFHFFEERSLVRGPSVERKKVSCVRELREHVIMALSAVSADGESRSKGGKTMSATHGEGRGQAG